MVNHQVVDWLWEHALKFNMCKLLSVIVTDVGQNVPDIPNRDLLLSYSFCSHILADKSEWKYSNLENLGILKEILEGVTQKLSGIFQQMDRMHYVKLISSLKFLIVLKSLVTQTAEKTKKLLLSYFPTIDDDVWQEIKKTLQYEDDSMRPNHENSNKLAREYFIQKLRLSSVGSQLDISSTVKTLCAVVEPILLEFTKFLRNYLQPTAIELISNSAHDDLSMSDDTRMQLLLSEIQNGPSEDRLLGVFRTIKSSTVTSFPERENSEFGSTKEKGLLKTATNDSMDLPQDDLKQDCNYLQLPQQSSDELVSAGKEVINCAGDDQVAAEPETCVLKRKDQLYTRPEHSLYGHSKVSQSEPFMKGETDTHNQTQQQCCSLKRFPGCIYSAGRRIILSNVRGSFWKKEQMKKQVVEKYAGEAFQATTETFEDTEKKNMVAETNCRLDSVGIPDFIEKLSGFFQKFKKYNIPNEENCDDLSELIATLELLLNKLKSLQKQNVFSKVLIATSDTDQEAILKENNRAANKITADFFYKWPSACISTTPNMQESQSSGGKHHCEHKSYDTESIYSNSNENLSPEIVQEAKMKDAVTAEKTTEAVSLSKQSSISCVFMLPNTEESQNSIINNKLGNSVQVHEKVSNHEGETKINLQVEKVNLCIDCRNETDVDTVHLENVKQSFQRDNVKRKYINRNPQLNKQTRSVTQKMKTDKLKRKRTDSSNIQLIRKTRNVTQKLKKDKVKVKRKVTQNDSSKQLIQQTRTTSVTQRIKQGAVQSKSKTSLVGSKKCFIQSRNISQRKKNGILKSLQRLRNYTSKVSRNKGEKLKKRVIVVGSHSNNEHSQIFTESDTEAKWFSAEEGNEQDKTDISDHQNQDETDAVKTKEVSYNNCRSEATESCEIHNVIGKPIFPESEECIVQKEKKILDDHCGLPLADTFQICTNWPLNEVKTGSSDGNLENSSCKVNNRGFDGDIVDTMKKRDMHAEDPGENSAMKRVKGENMQYVKEFVQDRENMEKEESVAVEEFQFQQCAVTEGASWDQENVEMEKSQEQTDEDDEGIRQDLTTLQQDQTIVTASPEHSEDSGKKRSPFILYIPFVQPCLIRLSHEGEMHKQDDQVYSIYN